MEAHMLWPFLAFVPFFFWLMFGRKRMCPNCGKQFSPFQSPFTKTSRQWLDGGYLCSQCGCETNYQGEKVVEGLIPLYSPKIAKRMLILAISLPTGILFFVCFLIYKLHLPA